MTIPTTSPVLTADVARDWVRRWDRQQEGYVRDREEAFGLMFDVIARLVGAPTRILDLGSGPGCLSDRALRRFPSAEVVAMDLDPVLLELGQRAFGDRIRWESADLRDPHWHAGLEPASFDVVVTATALHYLDAHRLPAIADGLARVLRPGAVYADLDTMRGDARDPRLADLLEGLRRERWAAGFDDGREDWQTWWDALREVPGMDPLFEERDRRFGVRRFGEENRIADRVGALRTAGFAEVAPFAQDLDKRLLIAIR